MPPTRYMSHHADAGYKRRAGIAFRRLELRAASRRNVLATLLAAGVVRAASAAPDDLSDVGGFIGRSGNELARLAPAAKGSDADRARLQSFVEQVVDVDAVAKFVVGRFWRTATAGEQQEYIPLFHRVLIRNITSRLGDYSGGQSSVVIGKPFRGETGITVPTTVERPGNQPAHVNWIVEPQAAGPRIVDVVVEGMSMRLALRSDYTAFIARNGNQLAPLLSAMRQQVGDPP